MGADVHTSHCTPWRVAGANGPPRNVSGDAALTRRCNAVGTMPPKARVEALADGTFPVAMALFVLDSKLPEGLPFGSNTDMLQPFAAVAAARNARDALAPGDAACRQLVEEAAAGSPGAADRRDG